jgi:nucleotide-binding universal stress UspA family protein
MYKKFLVPLDGSELGECVFEHLKVLVRGCNVPEVVLFHVIEPLSAQTVSALVQAGADTLNRVEQDIKNDAAAYMSKTTRKIAADDINAVSVIVEGNAADEILKYAAGNNIDMILLSTHGRSGISRFFMGSVSTRVVNHSTVPVLVISPPGCRK